MSNTLNIKGKLDFNDIDLTAPEIVTEEILQQLSEETNGMVLGTIKKYDGPVTSYVKRGLSFSVGLGSKDQEVNIQNDLGATGETKKKFECYIFTPVYEHYKFRVFFIEYGLSNYPVKVVLEDSVAESIYDITSGEPTGYIFTCNRKEHYEKLLASIFTSKRLIDIMQELIRINQATRDLPVCEPEADEDSDS